MSDLEVPKESLGDKIHSLVNGAIGTIPYVGSIASETFGLILAQPITKRRDKWMKVVADKLLSLEDKVESFKIENLREDDEFVSFLIESSQIAFKTHQDKKLNYLQNTIVNYFLGQLEFDKKYSFLRIIDELTPTHITILNYISLNESYINVNIKGYEKLIEHYRSVNSDKSEIDKFYFRKCIRDLEIHSLIKISKDFKDFIGGGSYAMDSSSPSIKLLDYGSEFMQYIETPK